MMHSNSKERSMIFNAEMVRAILSGQKTQTRRIMKNQPAGDYPDSPVMVRNIESGFQWHGKHGESSVFPYPLGTVGDRIWVRETWARYNVDQDSHDLAYRATTPEDWPPNGAIWRPSVHMPRWASRILLEITNVRVERLNDISEEDAKAEGVSPSAHTITPPEAVYRVGFGELWRSIYGDENWEKNPWVWVIEFKRVQEQSNV